MAEGAQAQQERPVRGYAALVGTFAAATGGFAAWLRVSGRELPESPSNRDLVLMTLATHKAARLVSKDRVTSAVRAPFTSYQEDAGAGEVSEAARGTGVRRAIGELIVCPYCVGLWIATALAAGFAVAPRPTRWVASTLAAVFGADVLQLAYKKGEQAL